MTNYSNLPELPARSQATKLVVFLHGVGSDGYDLLEMAPLLQENFPSWHFISPHGVEEFDGAPFGRQWFSLRDRTEEKLQQLIAESAPKLQDIISAKQKELSLGNSDTFIVGFSQGTMIGIYLTLQQEEPFAGMLAFSGKLMAPPVLRNTTTPILLVHGEDDDVVPHEAVDAAEAYLKAHKVPHQSHKLSNLGHSIDGRGISLAIIFLRTADSVTFSEK